MVSPLRAGRSGSDLKPFSKVLFSGFDLEVGCSKCRGPRTIGAGDASGFVPARRNKRLRIEAP